MLKSKLKDLRYRIDPVQKKLDELDRLEYELRQARSGMDDNDYHALNNVLIQRRQKLVKPDKPPIRPGNGPTTNGKGKAVAITGQTEKPLETAFKAVLALSVVSWLIFKNI